MTTTLTLSPAVPGSATATTFKNVQDEVIQTARLDPVADLTRTKRWINTTRQDVATETRGFRLSGSATLTAGLAEYTVDPKVHTIKLITVTQVGGTAWFPLEESSLDEILNYRAIGSSASGPPTRYAWEPAGTLELWPTPATGDTITIWYSYEPTDLSADGDTFGIPEPHAFNLHVYGALCRAAEFKRDVMMLGNYQSQYVQAMANFQRYLNRAGGGYPDAFPTWGGPNVYAPHDPSTDVAGWGS